MTNHCIVAVVEPSLESEPPSVPPFTDVVDADEADEDDPLPPVAPSVVVPELDPVASVVDVVWNRKVGKGNDVVEVAKILEIVKGKLVVVVLVVELTLHWFHDPPAMPQDISPALGRQLKLPTVTEQ